VKADSRRNGGTRAFGNGPQDFVPPSRGSSAARRVPILLLNRRAVDRSASEYRESEIVMAEINKVVAHMLDGTTIRGTTQDFYPTRSRFHVVPIDGTPVTEICVSDMKALFFVRDLTGVNGYKRLRGFERHGDSSAQGDRIAVHFRDGELLCGFTLSYSPQRDTFFLRPVDGNGNNLRVYVVTNSAVEIATGPAAEALAVRLNRAA
jgi:hypothetical protein